MYNENSTEQESAKIQKSDEISDDIKNVNSVRKRDDKAPSEFFIGSVTFAVFIVFMTVWMYFSD